jgi:hypothetical protein
MLLLFKKIFSPKNSAKRGKNQQNVAKNNVDWRPMLLFFKIFSQKYWEKR